MGAFRPGLYTIGAVSSLGKSTFCLQLADNLAAGGEHVLFFSIEQSKRAMHAKSVCRTMYEMNGFNPHLPTARELMSGASDSMVRAAEMKYAQTVGDRMEVIPCGSHLRAMDITATVHDFMKHANTPPVVIVDYVQRLKPNNPRLTERAAMDDAVSQLQDLQLELGCTVIAVSSLNRMSYLQPISFESVKESGGLEFTADVFWGLELGCMRAPLFEDEKGTVRKREIIKIAKKEIPREVRLVCLKNRDGEPSYDALFYYDAPHDYFRPVPDKQIVRNDDWIDFPVPHGRSWRNSAANASGIRQRTPDLTVCPPCDDAELTGETVTLSAAMVRGWSAGAAQEYYASITPPECRAALRHMLPSAAKADLMKKLADGPKRFSTYTDTPHLPA